MKYYCNYCETHKEESEFYISNKARCKDCVKAYTRQWRRDNIDQWRATKRIKMREYRDKHRLEIREYNRQYQMMRRKKPLDKEVYSGI